MTVLLITSFLLITIYISLLVYYRIAWNDVPVFQPQTSNIKHQTSISIIIPARNESENLPTLLRSLSAQTYPTNLFEVLIIDDHSTDDTAAIVKNYAALNIRLVSLQEHIEDNKINSYKKKAIETGIQQSTGSLIVTTDADCLFSPNWLQTIAAFYEQFRPVFIAAPVAFLPFPAEDGLGTRFLKIFQALDFMTLQGITAASVHKKFHSMCNGANMAYEKKIFYEVGGFKGIDNIASGDDMLLMHKIYKQYPERVLFLLSKDAIVQTTAVKTIAEFFNQRIRWASKADKYDDKRIFPVLLLVYLLNILLLVLPIIGIFKNSSYSVFNIHYSIPELWLILLFLKIMAELVFLFPVSKFFENQRLLYFFPVMQPFHILYTVIAGWLGKFGSYRWKERKVK